MVRVMADQPFRLPDGPDVALVGLTKAVARTPDALVGVFRGRGAAPVTVALGEALLWVGALDAYGTRLTPDYLQRRDADAQGRAVGGLVHARNFQAHQLLAAAAGVLSGSTPEVVRGGGNLTITGLALTASFNWVAAADLPVMRNAQGRDVMYDQHVAGRPLTDPLDDAVAWFSALIGPYPALPDVSGG